MNWFVSILIGLCAGVLAAVIVGTAADFWSGWLRVSNREGAAGYWVVMMALLGAIAALAVGIAVARGWLLSTPNFFSALGTTVALTGAATLLITGMTWLASEQPARVDGRSNEPPLAPMLTPEQEEAEADARQEAALRALSADAPLAQWLVFTRYGVPQSRIDAAIAAIRARPDWAAEMAHEMIEGAGESGRDALSAVEHIESPPAELASGAATVGKAIAQSLRDLEAETPGTEAHQALVNGISTRFSAWMVATRALRKAGSGDFVPELKEIVEPARRLAENDVIRITVVRVASFYLNEWAGIAPLPTDPPPR